MDSSDKIIERYLQSGVDFSSSTSGKGGGGLDLLEFGAVSDADALLDLETFGGGGLTCLFPKRGSKTQQEKTEETWRDASPMNANVSRSLSDKARLYAAQQHQKSGVRNDNLQSPEISAKVLETTVSNELKTSSPFLDSDAAKSGASNQGDGSGLSMKTVETDDIMSSSDPYQDTANRSTNEGEAGSSSLKQSAVDDIQESPTSPDPEPNPEGGYNNSLSLMNSQCKEVSDDLDNPDNAMGASQVVGDTSRDATSGPEPECKETPADSIGDSTSNPRPKSDVAEANVIGTTPSSHDGPNPDLKDDQANVILEVPPSGKLNSSSSENEAELVIASGVDTDSENLTIALDDRPVANATSSPLTKSCNEASMTSEEEDDGMLTRRRSARLRKADDSDQLSSPAKKLKTGRENLKKDQQKDKDVETGDSAGEGDKGTKRTDTESPKEQLRSAVDNVVKNDKPNAANSSLNPGDAESSLQPLAATKKMSLSASEGKIKLNQTAKRPNLRNIVKTRLQKSSTAAKPAGPMSSTIDTIMKLQEALHTRRRQHAPSTSEHSQERDSDGKLEPNQVSTTAVLWDILNKIISTKCV